MSNYHWLTATEDTSAVLWVNPFGPEMLIHSDAGTSTIGTVSEKQYTWNDDGSSMTLELYDGTTVPESIMQGEELRVAFTCKTDSTYLPSSGTSTYYRFDGEGEWQSQTLSYKRVPDVYEFINLERCVETRISKGGTTKTSVLAQVEHIREFIKNV